MNELDFGKRKVEEIYAHADDRNFRSCLLSSRLYTEECCFADYIYMEEQVIPVCWVGGLASY